jgi:hypothetical protein
MDVKLSKPARDFPCRLLMSLQFWHPDDGAVYCVRVVPDIVMV